MNLKDFSILKLETELSLLLKTRIEHYYNQKFLEIKIINCTNDKVTFMLKTINNNYDPHIIFLKNNFYSTQFKLSKNFKDTLIIINVKFDRTIYNYNYNLLDSAIIEEICFFEELSNYFNLNLEDKKQKINDIWNSIPKYIPEDRGSNIKVEIL